MSFTIRSPTNCGRRFAARSYAGSFQSQHACHTLHDVQIGQRFHGFGECGIGGTVRDHHDAGPHPSPAFVRDALELTAPALSKQVAALEEAEYVAVEKGYVGKRPRTWLALTPTGRTAMTRHLEALRAIAGGETT